MASTISAMPALISSGGVAPATEGTAPRAVPTQAAHALLRRTERQRSSRFGLRFGFMALGALRFVAYSDMKRGWRSDVKSSLIRKPPSSTENAVVAASAVAIETDHDGPHGRRRSPSARSVCGRNTSAPLQFPRANRQAGPVRSQQVPLAGVGDGLRARQFGRVRAPAQSRRSRPSPPRARRWFASAASTAWASRR